MSGRKSLQEEFFDSWNKEVALDEYSPYKALLSGLMTENYELYKIACSLSENYKNAHLMQDRFPNICTFLNEWLNSKKYEHTGNGKNYKNNELWETYIDVLWINLEKETERNYWCRRSFPSSSIANVLTTTLTYSNIRSSLHNYVNKKIRLKHNLQGYISNRLLGRTPEYSDMHEGHKRIHLSYHSE
ncbi:PIR Superfamily Protein [Plasmodium ovale wallikeri]|uniref:PIR Superfamily Protein n=1 Tax=Plasmodium ovale wallikeri TaxID=864142 RepID=A0A1A9AIZ7_PLAOA|nr:PIR Superfamily Protein [Plasmodium ovale wallikeri]SBT56588.1 PIR Superfamily Protein [Plasmodium ovale wallikeri]